MGNSAQCSLKLPIYLTQFFNRSLARLCQAFIPQQFGHGPQRPITHRVSLNALLYPVGEHNGKLISIGPVTPLRNRHQRGEDEPQNCFMQAQDVTYLQPCSAWAFQQQRLFDHAPIVARDDLSYSAVSRYLNNLP